MFGMDLDFKIKKKEKKKEKKLIVTTRKKGDLNLDSPHNGESRFLPFFFFKYE